MGDGKAVVTTEVCELKHIQVDKNAEAIKWLHRKLTGILLLALVSAATLIGALLTRGGS